MERKARRARCFRKIARKALLKLLIQNGNSAARSTPDYLSANSVSHPPSDEVINWKMFYNFGALGRAQANDLFPAACC